jgi:hypothetical protein
MCRPVTCRKCGKTTWAGCGQHVSQVLAAVPASQRCACRASGPAAGDPAGGAWLRGLFGRTRRSTMLADGVLTWKDSR